MVCNILKRYLIFQSQSLGYPVTSFGSSSSFGGLSGLSFPRLSLGGVGTYDPSGRPSYANGGQIGYSPVGSSLLPGFPFPNFGSFPQFGNVGGHTPQTRPYIPPVSKVLKEGINAFLPAGTKKYKVDIESTLPTAPPKLKPIIPITGNTNTFDAIRQVASNPLQSSFTASINDPSYSPLPFPKQKQGEQKSKDLVEKVKYDFSEVEKQLTPAELRTKSVYESIEGISSPSIINASHGKPAKSLAENLEQTSVTSNNYVPHNGFPIPNNSKLSPFQTRVKIEPPISTVKKLVSTQLQPNPRSEAQPSVSPIYHPSLLKDQKLIGNQNLPTSTLDYERLQNEPKLLGDPFLRPGIHSQKLLPIGQPRNLGNTYDQIRIANDPKVVEHSQQFHGENDNRFQHNNKHNSRNQPHIETLSQENYNLPSKHIEEFEKEITRSHVLQDFGLKPLPSPPKLHTPKLLSGTELLKEIQGSRYPSKPSSFSKQDLNPSGTALHPTHSRAHGKDNTYSDLFQKSHSHINENISNGDNSNKNINVAEKQAQNVDQTHTNINLRKDRRLSRIPTEVSKVIPAANSRVTGPTQVIKSFDISIIKSKIENIANSPIEYTKPEILPSSRDNILSPSKSFLRVSTGEAASNLEFSHEDKYTTSSPDIIIGSSFVLEKPAFHDQSHYVRNLNTEIPRFTNAQFRKIPTTEKREFVRPIPKLKVNHSRKVIPFKSRHTITTQNKLPEESFQAAQSLQKGAGEEHLNKETRSKIVRSSILVALSQTGPPQASNITAYDDKFPFKSHFKADSSQSETKRKVPIKNAVVILKSSKQSRANSRYKYDGLDSNTHSLVDSAIKFVPSRSDSAEWIPMLSMPFKRYIRPANKSIKTENENIKLTNLSNIFSSINDKDVEGSNNNLEFVTHSKDFPITKSPVLKPIWSTPFTETQTIRSNVVKELKLLSKIIVTDNKAASSPTGTVNNLTDTNKDLVISKSIKEEIIKLNNLYNETKSSEFSIETQRTKPPILLPNNQDETKQLLIKNYTLTFGTHINLTMKPPKTTLTKRKASHHSIKYSKSEVENTTMLAKEIIRVEKKYNARLTTLNLDTELQTEPTVTRSEQIRASNSFTNLVPVELHKQKSWSTSSPPSDSTSTLSSISSSDDAINVVFENIANVTSLALKLTGFKRTTFPMTNKPQ